MGFTAYGVGDSTTYNSRGIAQRLPEALKRCARESNVGHPSELSKRMLAARPLFPNSIKPYSDFNLHSRALGDVL